jgi:hypothetical protein
MDTGAPVSEWPFPAKFLLPELSLEPKCLDCGAARNLAAARFWDEAGQQIEGNIRLDIANGP